jgi:hypothetical protein
MRRKLITGFAVATAAVFAAAPAGASTLATAGDTHPAGESHPVYVAANGKAASSAAVKPSAALVSQDSSLRLSGMNWATWSDRATGTGIATVNLCDPDCATGKAATIPVAVTLSAPHQVCGREFYTQMQLAFTGTVPSGLPQTTSVPVAPFC